VWCLCPGVWCGCLRTSGRVVFGMCI